MIKLATVFSGIGAIEQALKQMNIEYEIVFACDNGERYLDIDQKSIKKQIKGLSEEEKEKKIREIYDATGKENNVKKSYFANYDITEDRWYEDIRFLNGKKYKGQVDLLVGGSPCQSFSTYGKRGGLEDTRGTLFYDYARLIKEIQPKAFIFENVTGLLNHDDGKTWNVIKDVFENLHPSLFYIEVGYGVVYLAVHFAESRINLFQHCAIRSTAVHAHDFLFAARIVSRILDDTDKFIFILHGRFFQCLYQSVPIFTTKSYFVKFAGNFFVGSQIILQSFGTFLRQLFVEFQRTLR